MSVMDKINIDLLVPLLIVCGLLRLKNLYNIPQKLLRGLRFFVSNSLISQKHLRPSSSDKAKQQNVAIIDQKLDDFGLSMIELDGSTSKGNLLSEMLLYNVYDRIVYLSVSSFFIHSFSTVFHCFSPNSLYSIWGALFVAFSVVVPFRALIRILFMTGFKAFESRTALVVGLVSFTVTALFLFSSIDFTGLSLDDVLRSTAIHCTALLLHISTTAPQLSELIMVAILKLILSILSAITAAGMVIPALRFSQSFCNLQFGAKYERASVRTRLLLAFDHFLPLLVALDMIPYGLICSSFPTYIKGFPFERGDGFWLGVQLLVIVIMVTVRLSCIKIYLQNFLDATVKTISIEILVNNQADAKGIQDKVASRFNYIAAAAVQFISIPLCALGLAMLVQKSSIAGTGLCVELRTIFGLDTLQMLSASASSLAYNATAAVLASIRDGAPTLASGTHLFLMSAGENGVSPSEDLRDFLTRFTTSLHLLPVGAFVSLGRAALCAHCLLWFFISSSAILYWFLFPLSLGVGVVLKEERKDNRMNTKMD